MYKFASIINIEHNVANLAPFRLRIDFEFSKFVKICCRCPIVQLT